MTDVIIIGAGPAGLTAAIYAQRAGKSVMLLEAKIYGGQIVNTPDIENYPGIKHISGFEYAQGLYEQAMSFGAEFKMEAALRIEDKGDYKIVKTANGDYEAKAVILATGAKNRPLGIEREADMVGKGVSYCATCDGMFYRGKRVAVNGGGNTAIEDAEFLSNVAEKVYVIHRRDEFRADAKDVERLKAKENVEFVLNSTVKSLVGEDKLTAIEVENKETGDVTTIEIDGLFIAIGQMPDNKAFADVAELDPKGYIQAGESCKTETPGVFTAGDCRTKEVRQLTTAAADGAVAALAAAQYIATLA